LNNAIRTITTSGSTGACAGLAGAASATVDGSSTTARFARPSGIAIDADGTIYVADSETNVIRRVQAGGIVKTIAGKTGQKGFDDGDGNLATFNNPTGLALNENEDALYIADTGNHTIRKISLSLPDLPVSTLAGVSGSAGWRDGEVAGLPLGQFEKSTC
jgi:sugar lactone lactonase YvrE